MAYIDDYNIMANDGTLFQRCQMSIISAAIAIQSESTATANHAARSTWALKVLANPSGYTQIMIGGIVTNGSIVDASTDSQIDTRVSSVWNAYAVQG